MGATGEQIESVGKITDGFAPGPAGPFDALTQHPHPGEVVKAQGVEGTVTMP